MPEPPFPKNAPGPFYVENQCVRAVRYAGNAPAILKRFRELRSEDSCDAS